MHNKVNVLNATERCTSVKMVYFRLGAFYQNKNPEELLPEAT